MPEPTTGAVIGAGSGAFAVGTITITWSFLGLQYEMLLAGLAGGLAMLSSLPSVSRPRAVMILITSALMGGYVGPMLHAWAIQSDAFAWSGKYSEATRLCSGFLIGASSQTVIPLALGWMRTKFGGGNINQEPSK